ncbi:unnamed protein product, partial [Rotaria magnacalcarata]
MGKRSRANSTASIRPRRSIKADDAIRP